MYIVAHSMGGLVTRSALLDQSRGDLTRTVPLFISIATPWSGHNSAKWGAMMAPTPVYAWIDMAPNSEYLKSIFWANNERLLLSPNVNFHLLFSFLPKESGDGSVEIDSELRDEAQSEAISIHGIPKSHAGVLSDDRTVAILNRLFRDKLKD
jgi:pimeloyl-ACP methyl ester carboxylesterase